MESLEKKVIVRLEERISLKRQSFRDDVSGRQDGGWGNGWDHSTYRYEFFNGETIEFEGSANAIDALEDGFDFFGKVTKKQVIQYVAEFYEDFECKHNCWKSDYVKKLPIYEMVVNTARHHVLINGRRYFKQFKAIKECLCESIKNFKHREFILNQGSCEVLVFWSKSGSEWSWTNTKEENDANKMVFKGKCGLPTFGKKDCGRHQ